MSDMRVGCILIIVGVALLIGGMILGANRISECHEKDGVMLQGQCVKADIIKL